MYIKEIHFKYKEMYKLKVLINGWEKYDTKTYQDKME